jgi:hypothetical protein
MPVALPYSKQSPGRTFVIAISVLGLVALTQIGALGWAFVKRVRNGPPPPPQSAVASAPLPPLRLKTGISQIDDRGENDRSSLVLGDPFGEAEKSVLAEKASEPIMPPAKPEPVPYARLQPAPDSRYAEQLHQGRTLRERGDTGTALVRFREAYANDPHNPAAIAEIAVTFEKMGVPEKAAEYWKRVYDMGESAGVYFAAAEAKLKEAMLATRATLQQEPENNVQTGGGTAPTATFGLGDVETEELNDPAAARRFVLHVPIQLRLKTKVSVKDLTIQVLFYDVVEDKPQRTNANVTSRWSTAPVDWRGDETELLDVEYKQPVPDVSDPRRALRNYYGYIVRLYYKDELQATRAEPLQLGQRFPASHTLEKDAAQ